MKYDQSDAHPVKSLDIPVKSGFYCAALKARGIIASGINYKQEILLAIYTWYWFKLYEQKIP